MALPRGPGMATRPICAGKLRIDPCVPRAWRSYSMRYQHQATCYQITVENPAGVTHGVAKIEPENYNREANISRCCTMERSGCGSCYLSMSVKDF